MMSTTAPMNDQIRADIVEEALRMIAAANERGVPLRLIGGLAVRLHAANDVHPALRRDFKDIDFATIKGRGKEVGRFIESMGYMPNKTFNTMNSGRRGLFYDTKHGRQVDVFVGSFEMCHAIPITDRIALEPMTIPLAELLLTKLQVVELNEKDQRDIFALIHEHEVGESDEETINAEWIAKLCANDWGIWRTCQLNVERSRKGVDTYDLSPTERAIVSDRLEALWARIEAEPKGAKWKLRGRVGDRKRWYKEPDEVG